MEAVTEFRKDYIKLEQEGEESLKLLDNWATDLLDEMSRVYVIQPVARKWTAPRLILFVPNQSTRANVFLESADLSSTSPSTRSTGAARVSPYGVQLLVETYLRVSNRRQKLMFRWTTPPMMITTHRTFMTTRLPLVTQKKKSMLKIWRVMSTSRVIQLTVMSQNIAPGRGRQASPNRLKITQESGKSQSRSYPRRCLSPRIRRGQ